MTLLHAGELYSGRDPRPLLDALRELETQTNGSTDRPRFQLEFLGRSTEALYDLPVEISRRGLGGVVSLFDQAPHAVAIKKMMAADVLVLIHSPGSRMGVPAKLYEYLGAGRPILALAESDGDIAWVLRESGVLHRLAPANDAAKIRQALLELGHEANAGHAVAGDPARLARFTRRHLAEQLAECLDGCVTGRSTALAGRCNGLAAKE